MAKSLILTYLFWLVGGAVGLHHVYLGRFKQAFLYWCMPGEYYYVHTSYVTTTSSVLFFNRAGGGLLPLTFELQHI